MRRPRLATLGGGVSLILIGVWIVLDESGAVGLSLTALLPALAAALGLMLLASGLEDRE